MEEVSNSGQMVLFMRGIGIYIINVIIYIGLMTKRME